MIFFDTRAVLAKIEKLGDPPASPASSASFCSAHNQNEAREAKEAASAHDIPEISHALQDALDAAEERAAIAEYEGGLSRWEANTLALQHHLADINGFGRSKQVSTDNLTFELIRRLFGDRQNERSK